LKLPFFIKKFFKITRVERTLFIKGLLISALFVLLVNFVPLKYYIRLLKVKQIIIQEDIERTLHLLMKTMHRLNRVSLLKMNCLVKSSVLKYLMNAYGLSSRLVLGVTFTNNHKIRAHAYVKINNKLSYQTKSRFVEVYSVI